MSDEEFNYLQDGFNPKTLKKDKLRDILLTHDVEYSNSMLKPQLLDLFSEHIVPRRAELRAKFVNVVASESNIEIATPPNILRQGRPEQDTSPAPEASPRARRARSRSPHRARQSDKVGKQGSQPDSKPTLQDAEMPDLAPPPSSPKMEPPKSPRSPRRRKLARKVEVSGHDSEPELNSIPTDQIKVKVPRSPRRKRVHEEEDNDQSFSNENVFQSGKQSGKKRRTEPKPETQETRHSDNLGAQSVNPLGLSILPSADLDLNLHIPSFNPELEELASGTGRMQASQSELGVAEQIEEAINRPLQVDDSPTGPSQVDSNGLDLYEDPVKSESHNVFPSAKETPRKNPSRKNVDAAPSSSKPARRGYIPNYFDLGVSKEFVEQLEPFLAPTPDPTPRSQSSAEYRQESMTPSANRIVIDRGVPSNETSQRSTPFEIQDPEEAAAWDLHEAVGATARKLDWLPALRFPDVHLPKVHLPKVRLPNVHLPRFQISQIHSPLKVDHLRTCNYYLFTACALILNCSLITIGVLLFTWYQDALSRAEYCGVGAQAPHEFPWWTTFQSSAPMITDLQSHLKDMMVEVWPECVRCSDHGRCYQGRTLICDSGYRPVEHPLALIKVWPLPPRCLPNWEEQRKKAVLSERAASHLREQRAQVLCDNPDVEGSAVEEATSVQASQLRSRLLSEKSPLLDEEEFEDLWQKVLQELPEKHSDVYVVSFAHSLAFRGNSEGLAENQVDSSVEEQTLTQSQNFDNHATTDAPTSSEDKEILSQDTWLASSSDANLPIKCRFRLYAARWLRAHRSQVATAFLIAITTFISGLMISKRRSERRNRATLMNKFLSLLKQQRRAADSDITGNTVAYLKASDLRKIVPRSQMKVVQDALESVDGVRMRQIEIYGEITRIWEWAP